MNQTAKRWVLFLVGIQCLAIGIVCNTRTNLGGGCLYQRFLRHLSDLPYQPGNGFHSLISYFNCHSDPAAQSFLAGTAKITLFKT